jgi:hypothetical protein
MPCALDSLTHCIVERVITAVLAHSDDQDQSAKDDHGFENSLGAKDALRVMSRPGRGFSETSCPFIERRYFCF